MMVTNSKVNFNSSYKQTASHTEL